jgi:hypothetical protein
MSAEETRYFTLEEARSLLPELKQRITALRALKRSMEQKAPQIAQLAERGRENAGSPLGTAYLAELIEFQRSLAAFARTGCILRDLDRGLLDFPARLENRDIFLCWAWGEQSIDWWHESDSGFAGRRPLGG